MKRLLACTIGILAVVLAVAVLSPPVPTVEAQVSFPYILTTIADPTGNTCASTTPQIQVRQSTGVIYTCNNGTVAAVSGGGGSGTVTSVATTAPITGGPFTTSGTIACATCVTSASALTNGAIMTGAGLQASQTNTTGTGVLTALGVNTGTAGAFVVNGGALGTPSGGTLTNATGLPAAAVNAGALASGMTATTQTTCDNSTKVATTAYAGAVCLAIKASGSPFSATLQSQIISVNTGTAYVVNLPVPTGSGAAICLAEYHTRAVAMSFVPTTGVTIYYKGIAGTSGSATGLVSGSVAGDGICLYDTDATTWTAAGAGNTATAWTNN